VRFLHKDIIIIAFLARDYFSRFPSNLECPLCTHPDTSDYTRYPNKEVVEIGGALMDLNGHGIQIKAEEDTRNRLPMLYDTGVMRHAVLVRLD
jgi:hypothetical protein